MLDAVNQTQDGPMGLVDILMDRSALSQEDLAKGRALQAELGGPLGPILVRIGATTEEQLVAAQASLWRTPIMESDGLPDDKSTLITSANRLGVPLPWLEHRRAALWFQDTEQGSSSQTEVRGPLIVVASDPTDPVLRERIETALARSGQPMENVQYFVAKSATVDLCLSNFKSSSIIDASDSDPDTERLRELAEEAPVIDFVNNIFNGAIREGASDVHIEVYENDAVVRYRVDGVLRERERFSHKRFGPAASRIKLLAGLDIAERRLPQDGRSTVRFAGQAIDLRVSSVPSTWGESLVIRLLKKQASLPDLSGLGFTGRAGKIFSKLLTMPHGVFLVTGPTGSGKSTTLYRGLEQINNGEQKIITIEDPVEYDVANVTQIQVRPEIGYTFARGLRAVLRQDPDVILVGEIRDPETAAIAVQASLTGHLVLSTLHTNSAIDAIARLLDLEVPPYLIAASLRGLMAQRLVRRLCDKCSRPVDPGTLSQWKDRISDLLPDQAEALLSGDHDWRMPVGCDACGHEGFQGRIAVAEIIEMDSDLRELVAEGGTTDQFIALARKQGFESFIEDGIGKAAQGITSLGEVIRVCGSAQS